LRRLYIDRYAISTRFRRVALTLVTRLGFLPDTVTDDAMHYYR